jgi:cytochrome c peroxidase
MKMKRAALLALAFVALAGCDGNLSESQPAVPGGDAQLRQEITRSWGVVPIGAMPNQNPALVELGRALFFDKILSGNRDIACASCHQPSASLGDGLSLAVGTGATGSGVARKPGPGRTFVSRQSPTLLNSGLGMTYLFWDGRLTSFHQEPLVNEPRVLPPQPQPPGSSPNALIAQAMLTVLNRQEMRGVAGDTDVDGNANELAQIGNDQPSAVWQAIMNRLLNIPEYVDLFRAAFPNKIDSALKFEDAALAIATFQRQEFTKTNTPFDRFLNRDDAAMTAEQKRGARLFFGKAQCSTCHGGPFLGANHFVNIGVPQIGPGGAKQSPLDLGRGELTNQEFYRFAFRIAPLRNVELTAPYMHNGAYQTLEAVVNHYTNATRALREYDPSQLSAELRPLYHGDNATVNAVLENLDFRLRTPIELTDAEKAELVAFLKALTDPSARDLSHIPPVTVPSGLPVDR